MSVFSLNNLLARPSKPRVTCLARCLELTRMFALGARYSDCERLVHDAVFAAASANQLEGRRNG